MAICDSFEQLAEATWERLGLAYWLGCSQGEETITDINILELKRNLYSDLLVLPTTKTEEREKGFDLDLWIGSDYKGWWRYIVQSKKLYVATNSYKALRHKVDDIKNIYQIDVLEEFAKNNKKAIPIYCFYNYSENPSLSSYWHCNKPIQEKQLGCSVVPLSIVKDAHKSGNSKTFESLHSVLAFPWRCLVCCPAIINAETNPLDTSNMIKKYARLPDFLNRERNFPEQLISELPDNLYISENIRIKPKKIIVVFLE